MRVAVIKEAQCEAPDNCDYVCAKVCPRVREGFKETVYAKENGKAAITESLCISCGICVKRCPFDAIRIINMPDEMARNLIFQYGVNTFRTFNIATPMQGRIVGLIGRNGIGKTTNIKLISNELKPNFGNYDRNYSEGEIIREFRGKEIQPYLTRLYGNDLKVSEKEQDFTLPGRVKEAVVDNKYGLVPQNLMERETKTLSGGEAQMVAIARTLDEGAGVYIFDEPMNYLDVNNRIRVAKTIRGALKDKTVVIVEHDLIMLDYLTDFVQILYGSDSNYGIASHIMPTRNGINTYLSGYLTTENVRFRNYEIKIKKNAPTANNVPFVSWPDFSVRMGEFTLSAKAGQLYEGDVIGVIGENGIGKSTFMKAVAGLVETDSGKLDLGIKIAYKPQIVERTDRIVQDVLASVYPNYASDESISGMLGRLGVNKLFNKNIINLSGGELQKLAIAVTIMNKADIYLFDEPSANLDIEDRLETMGIISSFINANKKCAIVVDHDLMFLDSTCRKSMLFSGESGRIGLSESIMRTSGAINGFLKKMDVTMRRDKDSGRPRINQPESRLDSEQKARGAYFEE